ncbi:hypothetical protein Q5692_35110 [Microcoleus sp. C2C3]|uniref:hypothetical protein n=1 Tax=unclassified Microcoleus TaxID=2642155 RepID=UPI002FD74CC2
MLDPTGECDRCWGVRSHFFIGLGGTERWLVYPIVLWITGLGGYLMNITPTKKVGDQHL